MDIEEVKKIYQNFHGGRKPHQSFLEQIDQFYAQRDLAASIEGAEWSKYCVESMNGSWHRGKAQGHLECQARIEALIEWLDNYDCWEKSAHLLRSKLLEYLKATHTSKEKEG